MDATDKPSNLALANNLALPSFFFKQLQTLTAQWHLLHWLFWTDNTTVTSQDSVVLKNNFEIVYLSLSSTKNKPLWLTSNTDNEIFFLFSCWILFCYVIISHLVPEKQNTFVMIFNFVVKVVVKIVPHLLTPSLNYWK